MILVLSCFEGFLYLMELHMECDANDLCISCMHCKLVFDFHNIDWLNNLVILANHHDELRTGEFHVYCEVVE